MANDTPGSADTPARPLAAESSVGARLLADTQTFPEIDTGTGWPEQPAESPRVPKPRRGGGVVGKRVSRWTGRAFWLACIAGVIVVLLLVTTVLGKWPNLTDPFKTRTTDRSQPVLLLSIQNLARFEAASGNFQVVVDIQEDQKYIPDIIFSSRSLFVAAGTVAAYVDFTNVGKGDVVASADRKSVTINLPAPQLEAPTLDLSRSYVYASSSGLVNKLGSLFGGDANKQKELYLYAQQKIAAAAVDSQLADRAATNTRAMLTELLRSLGFSTITVNFAPSS